MMSAAIYSSRPSTPPPRPMSLFTPPRQHAGKRKRCVAIHEDDEEDLPPSPTKHARRPLFEYSCSPTTSSKGLHTLGLGSPLLPSLPIDERREPRSSPMVRSPGMACMNMFTKSAYMEEEERNEDIGTLGLAGLGEALSTPLRINSAGLLCPSTPELSHSPSSSIASSASPLPCHAQIPSVGSCPLTPSPPVSRFSAARRWRPSAQNSSIFDMMMDEDNTMPTIAPPSPVRRIWGKESQLWHSPPQKQASGQDMMSVARRPSLQGLENGLWSREGGQEDCTGLGLGLGLAF